MNKQTIIPPSQGEVASSFRYGAITARLIALIVDWMIVFAILFVVFIPLFVISMFASILVAPILALFNLTLIPSFCFLLVLAHWIYFATMESSDRGATYGKRLFGLRVVDDKGNKLSFSRATLRYFAKIISAMPLMLGFVMAMFTQKKQALHDLIAETLVIKV
jgi:uncharacterized RDD family membrane protein YckC